MDPNASEAGSLAAGKAAHLPPLALGYRPLVGTSSLPQFPFISFPPLIRHCWAGRPDQMGVLGDKENSTWPCAPAA